MNRLAEVATACATFCAILGGSSIASLLISETAHAQGTAVPAANKDTTSPMYFSNCHKDPNLEKAEHNCLMYGAAIVPGKFDISRNRDVFGAASIGVLIGVQFGTKATSYSNFLNNQLDG